MSAAMSIAAVLWAWMVGITLVVMLWPRERDRRADTALILATGMLFGLGVTSVTYFFASLLFARPALVASGVELAVLGLLPRLSAQKWRHGAPAAFSPSHAAGAPRPYLNSLLLFVFVQAVVVAVVIAVRAQYAEPHGGWDAWAIWNLHARIMFRGGTGWSEVLRTPQLYWTHADYPLLVPASVARVWSWAGGESTFAAGLVSAIFALATAAILVAAVAQKRGGRGALLAGLLLVATPFFVTFSTNQHADIPLGAWMLAAVVLAMQGDGGADGRGFRILAGLGAAFAAWTKNEGLLFALVLAVACVVTDRRGARALLVGLAVGLIPVVYFKLALAPPNDLLAAPAGDRLARLGDNARHALIVKSLWRDLAQFGEWKITPYLAMALPFVAWRARRPLLARERLVPLVLGLMLAGYYLVYLLSPQDLAWHLDSSLVRLLLQLWPLAVLAWALAVPGSEPFEGLASSESGGLGISRPTLQPGKIGVGFVALNVVAVGMLLFALSRQHAANELASRSHSAAVPGKGWFGIERAKGVTWVWSGGDATLRLHATSPDNVRLRFSLRSLAPRHITIRSGEHVWWQGTVSEKDFVPVEMGPIALEPGVTTIEFSTDAPGVPEAAGPGARALAFAIYDFGMR